MVESKKIPLFPCSGWSFINQCEGLVKGGMSLSPNKRTLDHVTYLTKGPVTTELCRQVVHLVTVEIRFEPTLWNNSVAILSAKNRVLLPGKQKKTVTLPETNSKNSENGFLAPNGNSFRTLIFTGNLLVSGRVDYI